MASRHAPVQLGLFAVLCATAGCVDIGAVDGRYVERDEKRFTVDGKPELTLSTFDGSIEIRSWDQPQVLVVVERRAATKDAAARIDVQSHQEGNRVSVDVKGSTVRFWGLNWGQGGSARLIVSVPASADVRASSGDGSIEVERLSGTVALRSGDGSIRARDLSGSVTVNTGDGSIRLEDVTGTLEATTGDGSVEVAGKLSGVRVRTGDGSVRIHAQPGSSTERDWDLTSGDGSIAIEIPDGFGGELDAHTGDGRIELDGVTLSNVSGAIGRSAVVGRLGAGGRPVRVRTGDGPITLRRF